ncbi:MAG: hypothetical protein H6741_35020 [Alphaproteobacteria bacterium]|nr:hypothetical protein [Alphaproteobacteria bacterium]MCB9797922.1 hypothetical protein [Alphaproteobacteria bacterium]
MPHIALTLLLACAPAGADPPLFTGGLRPLTPEPPPGLSLDAEDCARCHVRVARQWRASGHAGAFSDLDFQVSWSVDPEGWCVQCHLPLAAAQEEAGGRATLAGGDFSGAAPVPGGLSEQGVSCAVCHVRGGQVLSAGPPSWKARRAHPIRQEPRLGEAAFCGGCHQFNLPRRGLQLGDEGFPFAYGAAPLQDTLSEHANAQVGGQRCQDCHLPGGRHSFPGAHDARFVAEALSVQVSSDGQRARVRVQAEGVGHAVPTGDPFRALVLELFRDPDGDEVVGVVKLRRRWAAEGDDWALLEDSRVPPPGEEGAPGVREVELEVSAPPVGWRLWMKLSDPALAEALPPERQRLLLLQGPVSPAAW